MDWNDLGLSVAQVTTLRQTHGFAAPDEVVRLAWGSPDLLRRAVGDASVESIRQRHPYAIGSDASADYKLGARLSDPGAVDLGDTADFDAKRSALLDAIGNASTDTDRKSFEQDLTKLYQRKD